MSEKQHRNLGWQRQEEQGGGVENNVCKVRIQVNVKTIFAWSEMVIHWSVTVYLMNGLLWLLCKETLRNWVETERAGKTLIPQPPRQEMIVTDITYLALTMS